MWTIIKTLLTNKTFLAISAISILLLAVAVQEIRVQLYKSDVETLQQQVYIFEDNEIKYNLALKDATSKIEDLQNQIAFNEQTFLDYVAAQKEKNLIFDKAAEVIIEVPVDREVIVEKIVEKPVEVIVEKIVVIDSASSDKIKNFINERIYTLHNTLKESSDE